MQFTIALAIFIRVLMDSLLKFTAKTLHFSDMKSFFTNLRGLFRNPFFLATLVAGVANFYLWCRVLAVFDLSYAYPLFSVTYPFMMLIGKFVFKEHIDRHKMIGICMICLSSVILLFS